MFDSGFGVYCHFQFFKIPFTNPLELKHLFAKFQDFEISFISMGGLQLNRQQEEIEN